MYAVASRSENVAARVMTVTTAEQERTKELRSAFSPIRFAIHKRDRLTIELLMLESDRALLAASYIALV